MDTILLVVGVVGLSISGWVLRGYFINTPSALTPRQDAQPNEGVIQSEPDEVQVVNYVTSEEHQQVLKRIAELERGGYSPKVEDHDSATITPESSTVTEAKEAIQEENALSSENWKEIFALQDEYRLQREKEEDIDYEREQILFDMSQSYDGQSPSYSDNKLSDEELLDQQLLDNQSEDGEDLDVYQERMNKFATLTREMLIMRLDAVDQQLREQQERHQDTLLNIIASLIGRMPNDANLKTVVQSSFVAASQEISNEDGEANRVSFTEMFFQNVGSKEI